MLQREMSNQTLVSLAKFEPPKGYDWYVEVHSDWNGAPETFGEAQWGFLGYTKKARGSKLEVLLLTEEMIEYAKKETIRRVGEIRTSLQRSLDVMKKVE